MSSSYSQLPTAARDVRPFAISEAAISDEEIQKLKQLLSLSRLPIESWETTQDDRRYGVTAKWMAHAKQYWSDEFDWRATESKIDAFPNFKAEVSHHGHEYIIHFIALFSENPSAVPVLCTHGWPGSVLEYLPLLNLVRGEYTPSTLPYHLIVPSLPGYAFSSGPPASVNFELTDAATILHTLLTQNLGFTGYIATGGDVGSGVSRRLAKSFPECKAMLVNFCGMILPKPTSSAQEIQEIESELSEEDEKCVLRCQEFFRTGAGYAAMQGTRPGTLAAVLESNPLSLLAWIGEKMLEWSDDDVDLETIVSETSLYWFTNTMSRCFYSYRGNFENRPRALGHGNPDMKIEGKPFGYQFFPKEIIPIPKAWAETTGTLTWYKAHSSGGHFAALERPLEMKNDLEEFLKHVAEYASRST